MRNSTQVFGRVTGNFTGTTDEIIQWTAVKWGLPDNVVRALAVQNSNWYQNLKDAGGKPVNGRGYGAFGQCGGSPAPSGYGTAGPASFGLTQNKWCALKDRNATGYGPWPYAETSTAYSLDLTAAVLRGCFEGWDTWLGGTYAAGDLWGCIGRWNTGAWHTSAANAYITSVRAQSTNRPWLTW